jgi:dienelactone hydrolase
MTSIFKYVLAALTTLVLVLPGRVLTQQAQEPKLSDLEKAAKAFVKLLEKGEFKKATQDFDATMKEKMPADKLEGVWKDLIQDVGAFKRQGSTRTEKVKEYTIIHVTCDFEMGTLETRVVFDKDKQIAGLFFGPKKKAAAEHQPPAYVKRDSFRERELTVNVGDWPLPATLSEPTGNGPWPAVVLVHGSGPQDRDETIGPNKPFRDLAWGLASNGIAVLRYVKRTKEHTNRCRADKDKITIKEEVIDDALAAVALLRKTERIDPKRIFVVGHSLGGMCVPRIGAQDPSIAGLISLAGSTRSLEDTVVDQFNYILSLNEVSDEQKKRIEELRDKCIEMQKQLHSGGELPAKLPLGFTATYLVNLHQYNPAQSAKSVKQPMLILQGERDYQVTLADFDGWKKALAARKDVTFKTYPKLNHLFMEGVGKARPSEYEKEGYVTGEVVEDIARWIKSR